MAGLRRALLAASSLAVLSAACGGTTSSSGADASCVGPYLNDQPPKGPFRGPTPTVRPGGTLTVYGHWYTETCNDTGGRDPRKPVPPVHLTITWPGGRPVDLGAFAPGGPDLGFSTEVRVPVDAAVGTVIVTDDRDRPARFAFEVRR